MVTIGVRELRDHLSEYLQKVEQGDTIRITKYGEEIARISPSGEGRDNKLVELLKEKGIEWSGRKPSGSQDPVSIEGSSASDVVIEDRR